MSKFCSGFWAEAPPERMLFFCCSSNSARISGSTGEGGDGGLAWGWGEEEKGREKRREARGESGRTVV